MKRWSVPVFVMVALVAASPRADAAEARIVLRGGAGWIGPTDEWTGNLLLTEGESVTKLSADSTFGPQISLEYRFTRLIGGEMSLLRTSHTITEVKDDFLGVRQEEFGQVSGWPILIGANFHLTKSRKFDLYLGPVIGWVIWGDLKPTAFAQQEVAFGTIKMHDEFAWGLNVGVDIPFATHWAFNFGFRALDYSARTDSQPINAVLGEDLEIPLKPLIGSASIALRW